MPSDLEQLTSNLLTNAIRYTPRGGARVRLPERRRGRSRRSRSPTPGSAYPELEIDRVFERFYRVGGDRARETRGTGLGLAIVRHVAETHLGDVSLESTVGAGSSFTVRLPLRAGGEP